MSQSTNPVDRANAELHRLAAVVYQDMANDMIPPDRLADDLAEYPARLREAWAKYLATGLLEEESSELVNAHVNTLVRADGKKGKPQAPRRPRLEQELRDQVSPRYVETAVAEMCAVLGLEYEGTGGPPTDGIPPGLVRAEAASEGAAVPA